MKHKFTTKAKLEHPARTTADSDLQPMSQCPVLTFGNALLVEVALECFQI
jgi:hypothetical protein